MLEAKWGAGTAGGCLSQVSEGELHEAKCDIFNKDQSKEDEVVLGSRGKLERTAPATQGQRGAPG